jgi:hypothetical protein
MISNVMPSSTPLSSEKKKRWPKIAFWLVLLIAIGSSIQTIRLQGEVNKLKNPQAGVQDQIQKTLDKVSKLILLPENETPTMATVSDLDKLKSQPFFANAKVGDQVIIYSAAKKAILWRPSTNKIVEIAPISIDETNTAAVANREPVVETSPSPTSTPDEKIKPKK